MGARGAAFVAALVLSLSWNGLLDPHVDLIAGAVSIVKVSLGVGSAVAVAVVGSRSIARGDLRFLTVWAWTGGVISVIAVCDSLGVTALLGSDIGARSTATFADPNLFAAYLVVSLPIILFRDNSLGPFTRSVLAISVVLALVTSGSRGAIAGVVVGFLSLTLLTFGTGVVKRVLVYGASAAAFVAFVAWSTGMGLPSISGLSRLEWAISQNTSDPRIGLWSKAWDAWLEHPLLGIGPGQFEALRGGTLVHNTYLSLLAESGLLGALAFVAFLAGSLLCALRAGVLGRFLLVGGISLGVCMLTLNLQNVRFVWVFIGLCLAVSVHPLVATSGSRWSR